MYDMYDTSYISDRCLSIPQLVLSHMMIGVICGRSMTCMICINCPRNMSCRIIGQESYFAESDPTLSASSQFLITLHYRKRARRMVASGAGFVFPNNGNLVDYRK